MHIPDPIIPLTGLQIKEIAPKLDISPSLLYLLVRKGHQPSDYTIRRIARNTDLPHSIWELPRHETIQRICEALRDREADRTDRRSSEPIDQPIPGEELTDLL